MSGLVRAELDITGRVQGVAYRASAQAEAERLGLVGEVWNEADGSVAAVAEGPKAAIEEFASWCREGPPAARVQEVRVRWGTASGGFRDFRITSR